MAVSETAQGIFLDGYVGEERDGFTAAEVSEALAGKGDVTLFINSPGGMAFEGAAIYAVLARHAGNVTCIVQGMALSAASLLVMGADDIAMADGAMMMIHDPMNITIGNADEHRESAGRLDTLATEYARVYAKRSGQSQDDVRAMMRNEEWMAPQDAVDQGFADRLEAGEADDPVAFDYTVFANAPEHLARMARDRGWTVRGRGTAAAAASSKEAVMPKKDQGQAQTSQSRDAAAGAAMSADGVVSQAPQAPIAESGQNDGANAASPATMAAHVQPTGGMTVTPEMRARLDADERRRVVMQVTHVDELTAAEVEQAVSETNDPADAKMKAVDMICAKRARENEDGVPAVPNRSVAGSGVSITRDGGDTHMEGVITALGNSIFGDARYPLQNTPGMQYRGLTLYGLAEMCAGRGARGMTRTEVAKAGMAARGAFMLGDAQMMGAHTGSDFSFITSELMNREMRSRYQSVVPTYRTVSAQRPANDFRTLYSVQFGGDFRMLETNEAGEYESTTLTDEGESYAVKRYGREINLTFELVVNDDMGALSRLPSEFARVARQKEELIVWGLILSNANLSDGTALFASARNNLAGSGAAISVATVGAGFEAMMQQRPPGAKSSGEDFVMATPDTMIVPPTQYTKAAQFVADTRPDTDANTNPYKGRINPVATPYISAGVPNGSNSAWYLADSSLPPTEHSFLSGYESPNVEVEEKRNPKGVTYTAEMMFGAGIVEPRGIYKNPGA
ncbi:head maturation protease, ClpP-related [Roseovarius sp. SYSU LYC5161]|uniref:head maturation protease, ClpP-related n=1 Tax=Roseovarius halophilus (ex Wu et al. 2025) TaxID=3376060 RepID=UPI00399C3395